VPDLAILRGRVGIHLGETGDQARADLLAAVDDAARASETPPVAIELAVIGDRQPS
jgi:hypothetical protein